MFGAYGNPYLQLPATAGLAVLAGAAMTAGVAAATIARHTPKVVG